MRVEDLMSKATCRGEQDSIRECARTMKEEDIGFLPICDEGGKPIGAITDRDLTIRALADGRSADEPVQAFMTRDVVTARVGDDVRQALELMRRERKSRVMVCDDQGRLQGVISLQDVAELEDEEAAGETLQEVKSDHPPAAH